MTPTPGALRAAKEIDRLYAVGDLFMPPNESAAFDPAPPEDIARIIDAKTALPELVEALSGLEEIASLANARQHAGADVRPGDWGEIFYRCNQARAALAKAKGDKP